MEYQLVKLIRQGQKSTVRLVREADSGRLLIEKVLRGRHPVYAVLKDFRHPGLPQLYEVRESDESTTVVEEYIEGTAPDSAALSDRQLHAIVRELCSVLGFLHGKGIVHRDIKPSNLLLAKDGRLRLIDFDAARLQKENIAQDTTLLGTRGYAPPEQYGFAQTDARSDIYALGVTLEQLLGSRARKPSYQKILRKCTALDPDKRYQSVEQVQRAFSRRYRLLSAGGALLAVVCGGLLLRQALPAALPQPAPLPEAESGEPAPAVLPMPGRPHWDGETGIAVWDNVPESGSNGELRYRFLVFRKDTAEPPDLESDFPIVSGLSQGNWALRAASGEYQMNLSAHLSENGFYYFAAAAVGDGVQYTDSSFAVSDAFHFTGEAAPVLPEPSGLAWTELQFNKPDDPVISRYATWENLDDYADQDSFNVIVFDASGSIILNNIWSKAQITSIGHNGIELSRLPAPEESGPYRFAVEVYSSRPNEYRSFLLRNPVPEECLSPWYPLDPPE